MPKLAPPPAPKRKEIPETLPIQIRSLPFDRQAVNEEARTAEFPFSSESLVERFWGYEILDHAKKSVRLTRLREAGPLLDGHDWDKQIGVVEKVWLEDDRAFAIVRFSKNPAAEEVFRDVIDKIKRNVSVSYIVHEMLLEKESDHEPDEYRITDWEPIELSIVSVPADYTVGMDRNGQKDFSVRVLEKPNMAKPTTAVEPANGTAEPTQPAVVDSPQNLEVIREQTRTEESKRVRNIYEIGRRFECLTEAEAFVRDGKTLEEFQHFVLVEKLKAVPIEIPQDVTLGLNQRERSSYSLVKAIREAADIDNGCRLTGLEKECSIAIEKQLRNVAPQDRRERSSGNSFYVPTDLRMAAPNHQFDIGRPYHLRAPMDVTINPNVGRDFVAEDFIPSLIEFLRNALMVRAAGATVLTGLQGNVVIPKQVGPTTAFWLTEIGAVTPSDLLTHQIGLRPRRLAAQTVYSRQLVIQSSLDVEALIRSDLANTMAQEIDRTALFGNPTLNPNSPRGIFGLVGLAPETIDPTDNVQQVTFQANWDDLYLSYIEFVVALAQQNMPMSRPAWIVSPATWGRAMGTPKFPNTGFPIVDGESVLGYPFLRTNQIPMTGAFADRVVFGDWAQLLIGQWAGLEMIVDPYTRAGNAQIVVTVNQFADLNFRYRRAFVVSTNAGALLAAEGTKAEEAPKANTKK